MQEVIVDLGVDVSTLTPKAQEAAKELAELRNDAERYRWLRHAKGSDGIAICELCDEDGEWYALGMTDEAIDATVDAAMAQTHNDLAHRAGGSGGAES